MQCHLNEILLPLQEKELLTQNLLEKERNKVEKQSESVREKHAANMFAILKGKTHDEKLKTERKTTSEIYFLT